MAKIQVKYLTKITNEVLNHIKKFDPNAESLRYEKFLEDRRNFCLLIFAYGKLDSLIFLKNNEERRELIVDSLYMVNYITFKDCIRFLENKFFNYKIVIDNSFKDKNFITTIKKLGGIKVNDTLIINL